MNPTIFKNPVFDWNVLISFSYNSLGLTGYSFLKDPKRDWKTVGQRRDSSLQARA